MKKLIVLLLVVAMLFSLVACSSDSTDSSDDSEQVSAEEPVEGSSDEDSDEDGSSDEVTSTNTSDLDEYGIPTAITLSDSAGLEGKKIGCTISYKGDEWCYQVSVALETLGEYYGADITVEDGDLNDETQTKQIENMIANDVDIIFACPVTWDGSNEALMKAVDADIPVIIYDGIWSGGEEYAVSNISWDQYETGRIVARYFVEYVKENMDGKCTYVELTNAMASNCQQRYEGFHEIIEEANADGCEITLLGAQHDTQGNRETAYNAIAAIAEPYDFIISDSDNGAMGAVSALQAVGNVEVKVLSMGAYGEEPFGMLYDEDPNYLACLNVDAWVLAQAVVQAALDYYDGKEVATTTYIDLYMVDSSNVEEFWSFE